MSLPDIRPGWLTWRTALLCMPLLLLIWMATSSYEDLRTHQERVNSSDRVLALLSALIQVHAGLQEAESSQRGFLLTGKESYLMPYLTVKERADDAFVRMVPIVKVLPGGEERLARIKTLATAKLNEMQQTVDLYHSKGPAAALALVETDEGQHYMTQIRTEINGFAREAYEASDKYRDASVQATTRTTVIVTLGASALFLLLAVATILIELEQKRQRADALKIQELNQTLENKVQQRTRALEQANQELETFCYSVSHDLRAPLRSVEGFAKILTRDYTGRAFDDRANDLMRRMSASTIRMGQLIDDLLNLSRIGRGGIEPVRVDLSELARGVVQELAMQNPGTPVDVSIEPGLITRGDPRLLRVAIENLFGNGWKFSRGQQHPRIEFGHSRMPEGTVYFIRDNGAGFDMAHSAQLFVPFQRLHSESEFEGSGIGLATVHRVIQSHGGRIWAESKPGGGATFYFTIQTERSVTLEGNQIDFNGGGQSRRRAAHG